MARLLFAVPQGRFILAECFKVRSVPKNKGVAMPSKVLVWRALMTN